MAPIADKREPRSATPFDQWAGAAYRGQRADSERPVAQPPFTPPLADRLPAAHPIESSSPSSTAASAPRRRIAPIWSLLAALTLIAAVAIGWLARGSLRAPATTPAASVALPAATSHPTPLSLATTTAPVETSPLKAAEPQAAMRAPSTERRTAVMRDKAKPHRTGRSGGLSLVATDRAKIGHASEPKGHAQSGAERVRASDRSTNKRAPERQRYPVVAPSHRNSPTGRSDTARAAGINCRRARNDVTAAICSDAGLAALDRQLTSRFAALDRSADPATVQRIHHGETTFLNSRQSCRDRECIAESYRQRLRELDPN